MKNVFSRGHVFGLAAALLFGLAAPLCKALLPAAGPFTLAGLLYLGAFAAMLPLRRGGEARVGRADAPALLGMIVLGGICGPVLLLFGLARSSALSVSLLLNLEAPLTVALAVAFFREHLTPREAVGALLVAGGAALLGARTDGAGTTLPGVMFVTLACAAWAVDNVLSGSVSLKDPVQIVRIKTLPAGATNLAIGSLAGESLPPTRLLVAALLVGAACYGASLVLHVRAQRELGAARQAALFATAPFAGALGAIALLGERVGLLEAGAALAMALGVTLVLRARHSHAHTHPAVEHDHAHTHDEQHVHAHSGPVTEPHSHPHQHEAQTHEHAHVSDAHHRHRHP